MASYNYTKNTLLYNSNASSPYAVQYRWVNAPPLSGSVYDDEFNGTSFSSTWTSFNATSFVPTITARDDYDGTWMRLSRTAAPSGFRGYVKTTPTGDWTLITRLIVNDRTYSNGVGHNAFLLLVGDPANPSTSAITMFGVYFFSTGAPIIWGQNNSNYTTYSSSIFTDISLPVDYVNYYLRVIKSGTSFSFSYSGDGNTWTLAASGKTLAFTVSGFGIGTETWTPSSIGPDFDFFRYYPATPRTIGRTYNLRTN